VSARSRPSPRGAAQPARWLVVAAAAALCVPSRGAPPAPPAPRLNPIASCPRTETPPVVDGRLDEAVWAQATQVGPLVRVATGEPPEQATTVRVVRAGNVLYVAFDCAEDRVGQMAAAPLGRDHPRAWAADCVHVFLAPGNPREYYCHLTVTAANDVSDEDVAEAGQDRSAAWDAHARTATRLGRDGWTCEIALPLTAVGETAPDAGAWAFNVGRAEQPHREWSTWAPVDAGFHEVARFGALRWDEAPALTSINLPAPFLGPNTYGLSAAPAAGLSACVELLRDARSYPRGASPVPESGVLEGSYQVVSEGPGAARLVVRRQGDPVPVCVTPPVRFRVPEVQRSLARLRARLDSLRPPALPVVREAVRLALRAAVVALGREAADLREQERVTAAGWEDLGRQARALAPQVRMLELRARLEALHQLHTPLFALGSETSLRKLAPDDSRYRLTPDIRLDCARRERESAQLVVASLGTAVKGVTVSWTSLTGPGGTKLGKECVEVSRVGYVTTRPPDYPVERVGRWPDPLLPLEPFDVPAGEVQPLWVTLTVPADAAPGRYVGWLTVSDAGLSNLAAKLTVDVWDVTLPLRGRFHTGFGVMLPGDISEWFGLQGPPPPELRHRLESLLLRNRVNPAGLYADAPFPPAEDLDECWALGMNAWCLGNVTRLSDAGLTDVSAAARKLRERGLLDSAYVIGYGETDAASVREAGETFRAVRRLAPGLRRVSLMAPLRDLWGLVSTWGTMTSDYDPLVAQSRARVGEETWWTICCGPRHPYANFFVDYPALDARALMWGAHKWHVAGFLYYEVAMWASNMRPASSADGSLVAPDDPATPEALRQGKRWPQVPWNSFTFSRYNGDGQLVYPWGDGDFLPSLRLEVIRDGIEDYELLAGLEESATRLQQLDRGQRYGPLVSEAMQLAAVRDHVVHDVAHFAQDPGVLVSERRRVLQQTVRVQRALGAVQ
jgi:hypothetical protein